MFGHGRRFTGLSIVLLLLSSLAEAVSGAPGDMTPGRSTNALYTKENPDSALAVVLDRIEGESLTLEDATRLAAQQSTSVRDAEAALRAAAATVRAERGAFDPEAFGEAARSRDARPTTSPFAGADVLHTDQTTALAGARIRLPIGTDLEASLNTTKSETNSIYASLDPQYDTSGRITIRQPLLSGFGPAARRHLSASERLRDAARFRYEDALLAERARIEETYWDLYAAERDYAVRQLILDRAVSLRDEAGVRARAGIVGPNEVANARVFVAEQKQALLDSEEILDQISDRIASLIGARPGGGSPRFRPADEPPPFAPLEPADSVVAKALRGNRALRAASADAEALRAQVRGARWDALPALDLIGSIGGNGLSGTGRDVVFGADTLKAAPSGGFGDTWRQVRRRDYPTWSAGLRLTIPIGFRAGRGERDRLGAEAARADERTKALARDLEEQVRAACRELDHASRRLDAARDGVDASQEQVRIGLVQYRNGQSTAFELVRLGADLAAAQQRFSQALVRSAKAAARLRFLTSGAYPAPEIR